MGGRAARVSQAVVVLVVLVLHLCWGKKTELCDWLFMWPRQYCHHNQSGVCGFHSPSVSCSHQLYQDKLTSDLTATDCLVEKLTEECGSLHPAQVYANEKPLVGLRLLYYSTWMGKQAVVNFTFPRPDWNSLKFQYKVNNSQGTFCRQFSLHGLSLPLNNTLVYDCAVFNVPGNAARDAEVVFENDKGEGRTFTFRVPSHLRIHPLNTSLSDWHVFFYLHHDFIATASHLPVTVQSVTHFHGKELSYKVSIVKCLDTNTPDCGSYTILNSTLVAFLKEDEWTVRLPIWSNPGNYAITVQLVSDQCHPQAGCYVAMSPKFEIKASLSGIWISVGIGFFLISFLTFLVLFNQRLRTNKDILEALREDQPSVLVVYLAESQPYMEFINIFTDFLKNTCHIRPYQVDRDVGIQDPNCWTRDHIIKADKVLFIVPENPNGESITPIRNQWIVALNYLSLHHFTTRQVTCKVAAVILPSSGSIPYEILHACRFKLVDQIASLVTWLHNGTLMDQLFLWWPQIRSLSQEKSSTWSDLRDAALSVSTSKGQVSETNSLGIPVMHGNIFLRSSNDQTTALRDDVSLQCVDYTTTDGNSEVVDLVFDPDIPSFDKLLVKKSSKLLLSSQDSDELSDSDDSDDNGVFT